MAATACGVDKVQSVRTAIELRTAREAEIRVRRAKAATIGHSHNRLLEFVKNDVSGRSKTRKYTFDEEMAFAAASCTRFMKSEGVNYSCDLMKVRRSISAQVNIGLATVRAPRSDLSPGAIDYLAQIESAGAAAISASDFASAGAAIAANAEAELAGDDLDAVLAAVALGDSSFTYWETQSNTFVADYVNNRGLGEPETVAGDPNSGLRVSATVILTRPTSVRYGWFSGRAVANWDITGCIVATVFTGGGCLGGGGAASVAEAIFQILQHYT